MRGTTDQHRRGDAAGTKTTSPLQIRTVPFGGKGGVLNHESLYKRRQTFNSHCRFLFYIYGKISASKTSPFPAFRAVRIWARLEFLAPPPSGTAQGRSGGPVYP